MMLHGAPSSKPTICFSNMREIGMLDLGTLTVSEKEKRTTKKLTRILPSVNFSDCICMRAHVYC